ncbi:type VI secretion system PAAR protein [Halomonas sp. ANAO-440]|uniref:type VI secretion system PAAR protein n=1 Tax=Halomonas sp. ANAO-440 TaxID=2861360 RepID=UPI001CAA79D2|nr:type VI secretion system PAAR protein [Halomonas sp. ANAO-440]MBZ0331570.1 type VI secretion system PAAR protein [Halomonas sp. ANAO-440]
MGRKFVLVGDIGTDHHGYPPTPVIAGSATVIMDGKPMARITDPLAPHARPGGAPHARAIAEGSGTILIEGKPAALTGHSVNCGGVVIGSASGEGS